MDNLSVEIKIKDTDWFKEFLSIFKEIVEDKRVPVDVKNEAKEKFNKLSLKYKS